MATPNRKLQSSPTPAELVVVSLIMFLIRQTGIPARGDTTKEAIRAGSSEKSSLINPGIRAGRGISRSCITAATAANTAVTAIFLMFTGVLFSVAAVDIIKSPFCNPCDFG